MTLLDRCREVADLPQAIAAIDLAMWDLAGKRASKPVCELLTDAPARTVPVNATIATAGRAAAASGAAAAIAEGYSCVKLKVGLPDDTSSAADAQQARKPGGG